MATFVYDGDGNRVKSTINGTTTTFVGAHYELTGSTVTKYYFAGASRIAMRKYTIPSSMSVEYFLGDHLGSTSITTDANGVKTSEMRYKPWGEVRSWWTSQLTTTPAYKLADYTFTGQYSYMDDPSTSGVTEGFGLMFYNARLYDPAIGRFTSADTIVPGGLQGLDRYAYANNSPIIYIDPSGHTYMCGASCEAEYEKPQYGLDDMADMYDVIFDSGWDVLDEAAALGAVYKVAKALQKEMNSAAEMAYQSCLENRASPESTCSLPTSVSAQQAFDKNFSQIKLVKVTSFEYQGGTYDAGCMTSGNTITCASLNYYHYENKVFNLVHELGHVFDPGARVPKIFVDNRDSILRANNIDFMWQSNTAKTGPETFGDLFVAWVHGVWGPNGDTVWEGYEDLGSAKDWMTTNMSEWIRH